MGNCFCKAKKSDTICDDDKVPEQIQQPPPRKKGVSFQKDFFVQPFDPEEAPKVLRKRPGHKMKEDCLFIPGKEFPPTQPPVTSPDGWFANSTFYHIWTINSAIRKLETIKEARESQEALRIEKKKKIKELRRQKKEKIAAEIKAMELTTPFRGKRNKDTTSWRRNPDNQREREREREGPATAERPFVSQTITNCVKSPKVLTDGPHLPPLGMSLLSQLTGLYIPSLSGLALDSPQEERKHRWTSYTPGSAEPNNSLLVRHMSNGHTFLRAYIKAMSQVWSLTLVLLGAGDDATENYVRDVLRSVLLVSPEPLLVATRASVLLLTVYLTCRLLGYGPGANPRKTYRYGGRVRSLRLYPFKSLAAVEVTSLRCTPNGAEYGPFRDRLWVLVDGEGRHVSTAQYPQLMYVRPRFSDIELWLEAPDMDILKLDIIPDLDSDSKLVTIRFYDHHVVGVDCGDGASSWFQAYLNNSHLRIVQRLLDPHDAEGTDKPQHVMILSRESLASYNTKHKEKLTIADVRYNILLEDCPAYLERRWASVCIGQVTSLSRVPSMREEYPVTPAVHSVSESTLDTFPPSEVADEVKRTIISMPVIRRHYRGFARLGTLHQAEQTGIVNLGDEWCAQFNAYHVVAYPGKSVFSTVLTWNLLGGWFRTIPSGAAGASVEVPLASLRTMVSVSAGDRPSVLALASYEIRIPSMLDDCVEEIDKNNLVFRSQIDNSTKFSDSVGLNSTIPRTRFILSGLAIKRTSDPVTVGRISHPYPRCRLRASVAPVVRCLRPWSISSSWSYHLDLPLSLAVPVRESPITHPLPRLPSTFHNGFTTESVKVDRMTEDKQRMTKVEDEHVADALTNMQPHCDELVSRLADAIRGLAVPRVEEAIISLFDVSHATISLLPYSHLQRSTPASISHFKSDPVTVGRISHPYPRCRLRASVAPVVRCLRPWSISSSWSYHLDLPLSLAVPVRESHITHPLPRLPSTFHNGAMERSLEQRYAIKFCVRLGKNATETFRMLQKAFKDDCISRSQSGKWHKAFKEGREEVADEPRSGRPTTARTDENADRVLEVLRTDRR
ncbi:hypothetical protein LAZ67_7003461 [Cordylochernes scorpioides]|uniref:Mos1 transposase HTH domain-containing protein n=1 Tax=Cordylochernes scorpioides TaxID=51811 RepID=A0ABY6KRS1_9ARAC|nr:hypothetical protein LAZ67_7003461 [Cordylochernes scorpioides]